MNRYSFFLLTCVGSIFAMGLLMIFNTTAAEVLDGSFEKNTHFALIKQLCYFLFGLIVCCGIWHIGYQKLLEFSSFFLIGGTLLLILVLIPGIGQQINGARRWIFLFGNSLQPSEFMKCIIPLFYIQYLSRNKELSLFSFLKLLSFLSLPLGLILIEPDNGTAAILLATLLVLFILSRVRWIYWALPLGLLLVGGAILASQMPHVSDRLKIYFHPELDLQGKGHQPYQAKIATGSGGFWGRGFTQSIQKLHYLPEARSDYIAAIFAEELGFLGVFFLILFYMLIAFFGFYIAHQAKDLTGFYVASIFTFLISFQAFLNLGVVSGLLPSKGTNLPFFSQGGSSLVANMFFLTFILSVAHRNSFPSLSKSC
jgi:cell division protein FtsW